MTDETLEEIYHHNLRRKKIGSVILAIILGSLLIISAIPIDPDDNQIIPQNLPFYGNATDFTLTNSNNESYNFSQDPRIKVVSFFYTKCPDGADCEADRITLRMAQLFAKVRQNNYLNNVRFLSIDFDYTNDMVADLGPYAKKYTEDTENWQFLIGNKTEIDNLTSEWNYYVVINN
ncbi:MAG: SCO family protein, partial [Candidatus Heimdallarchaeota archaeon]